MSHISDVGWYTMNILVHIPTSTMSCVIIFMHVSHISVSMDDYEYTCTLPTSTMSCVVIFAACVSH